MSIGHTGLFVKSGKYRKKKLLISVLPIWNDLMNFYFWTIIQLMIKFISVLLLITALQLQAQEKP